MTRPFVLPLIHCTDLALVGGKALGLARLATAGFPVPPGICVTTEAYDQSLQLSNFSPNEKWRNACTLSGQERASALADCQARIREVDSSLLSTQWLTELQTLARPSNQRWAVRSSATNEDAGRTSFAGLYRTHLGLSLSQIDAAIKDLWASLWQDAVVRYTVERIGHQTVPAMAVVIQPMLDARTSGVAYSIHPVTGRSFHVAVNAVPGLAAPLVDGQVTPDQYVVEMGEDQQPVRIRRRTIATKPQRLIATEEGLRQEFIPEPARTQSSLSDEQLFELARTAKKVEQAFGYPVDLEWAIDARMLWTLQARPITGIRPSADLTDDDCEWSRANFKETMPELPSPLGLSFLELFMKEHIIAPYRRLGCHIPEGLTSTRVLHGRPYLNVTLFHSLVAQLRGNPSLLSEHMGGEPIEAAPSVQPIGWLAFIRAGIRMLIEMRRAVANGDRWFADMKERAERYDAHGVGSLSFHDTIRKLDELGAWLDTHELTFGIAGGVAQSLDALDQLLPRWLGSDWRTLLNDALQGQGTVISAQQIFRLAELAELARNEPVTEAFLSGEPWSPSEFRQVLKGTGFLRAFESYVKDYGHTFEHLKEEIISLNRTIAEKEQQLTRLVAESSTLANKIAEQRTALEQSQNDITDLHRRLTNKHETGQRSEEEKQELYEAVAGLKIEMENLRRAKEGQVAEMKKDLSAYAEALADLRSNLEQSMSENASLHAQLQATQDTSGPIRRKKEETLPAACLFQKYRDTLGNTSAHLCTPRHTPDRSHRGGLLCTQHRSSGPS